MSRRYRIAAPLATLAAATTLSLAATGSASAQEDLYIDGSNANIGVIAAQVGLAGAEEVHDNAWGAIEDAQEEHTDATEEAQEDILEEAVDLHGLHADELDDPGPDMAAAAWQVDW